MPGLSFLSKKGWHTSNLKNVEKVWLAEQTAEDEKKKLNELQKQIAEERQIQELRQLQVASGQVVKTVDTTLDWMYEGPSGQLEQNTEEFLLGKIYKQKDNENTDIHKIGKDPGSLWLNKVSSKNDTFTRTHEDPMLMIKQNEKSARENIINNPVKMASIQHRIAQELEQKKLEKKEKKKLKKEKKHTNKRKDENEEKRYDSDSNYHKKDTYHRDNAHQVTMNDTKSHKRKRDSNSRSRSTSRGRNESYYRSRSNSVSDDDDRNGSSNNNRKLISSQQHHTHVSSRSRSHSHSRSNSPRRQLNRKKFGLIRNDKNNDHQQPHRPNSNYHGPNIELLEAKKKQKELEEQAKLAQKQRHNINQLTDEERERRLKEMEMNAHMKDEIVRQRQHSKTQSIDSEKNVRSGTGAEFIRNMRTVVYNTDNGSMEDRLSRNRQYSQRSNDLDSHGFLKKA